MITEEMKPALLGTLPSVLATVDIDNTPNVSFISQVFYVDDTHVALSNQFFNKSMRNIKNTGVATVNIMTDQLKGWHLHLQHKESKTDGEVFEQMTIQLEIIASMCGMEDVFKLQAAEIFEINKVETV